MARQSRSGEKAILLQVTICSACFKYLKVRQGNVTLIEFMLIEFGSAMMGKIKRVEQNTFSD